MITANLTGVERIKEAFARLNHAAQYSVMAKTADALEESIDRQVDKHTKTGILRRSLYKKPIQGGFEIGHDERIAPYAKFVHWGTKPHVIKPKDKKALKFVGKNGMVYMAWGNKSPQERAIILAWMKKKAPGARAIFRDINHPGYVGHPWLKTALEVDAPKLFEQFLKQAINDL
jgi:hypothetical protein